MIALARKTSGYKNVLFLIDEAGQYVAPRGELILNLDGLARNLKELGKGRVWIAATGQQTLAEIVEQAAYNSSELNKLRDRFPINIPLDARDIREITYLRLLTKSDQCSKNSLSVSTTRGHWLSPPQSLRDGSSSRPSWTATRSSGFTLFAATL